MKPEDKVLVWDSSRDKIMSGTVLKVIDTDFEPMKIILVKDTTDNINKWISINVFHDNLPGRIMLREKIEDSIENLKKQLAYIEVLEDNHAKQ